MDPLSLTISGGSVPSCGVSVILALLLLVAKILIPILLHLVDIHLYILES